MSMEIEITNDSDHPRIAEMPYDFLQRAVAALKPTLQINKDWPVDEFKLLFEEHGLEKWFWHVHDKENEEIRKANYPIAVVGAILRKPHTGWGMGLRNYLRDHGLRDGFLPRGNWDDYYIPTLEIALGFRPMPKQKV